MHTCISMYVCERGDALVESTPFVWRVMGSTPALAAA